MDELAETIKNCYPRAFVTVVTDIADVQRFLGHSHDPLLSKRPRIAVMSKELFKSGSGFRPAIITDRRHFYGQWTTMATPCLPSAAPTVAASRSSPATANSARLVKLSTPSPTFRHRPRQCCYDVITAQDGRTKRLGCGSPLYQHARTIGTTGIYAGVGQGGFKRMDDIATFYTSPPAGGTEGGRDGRHLFLLPSRPGLVRMPIADYIARRHPDQVGLVIWDEAHTAKGESTDTGHALARIAQVADHVLLMTGTLFGGKASTVFHLAYRISPHFRRRWRWNQLQEFVERYGVLEKKTITREAPDNRGSATRKTRITTNVRELPSCSPALVSLFLGFTIFTGLNDLGISLPPISRRIIHATSDPDHATAYSTYADRCKDELKAQKENDVDLSGSLLHTLRGHAVAPWRPEYLKQKVIQPVDGRMRHVYTRLHLVTNSATCAINMRG